MFDYIRSIPYDDLVEMIRMFEFTMEELGYTDHQKVIYDHLIAEKVNKEFEKTH